MADRARNASGLGKSVTLNVLTPITPGATWIVRFLLWFLDVVSSSTATARDLSFLSFVHWVVVPRDKFPRLDPAQPKERLHYDYLIFFSSFTGPWEPYIDAFADVLHSALDLIWFWTIGYPGARPVSSLLAHIGRNRIESDHYYSAYPGASVRDVQAALIVEKALTDLAALAATLPPDQFADEYSRVVLRVQNHLGDLGVLPYP